MAADEPAKAPPLYEPASAKSTPGRRAWTHVDCVASCSPMRIAILLAIMFAACGRQAFPPANDNAARPVSKPVESAAKAFAFEEKTDLIEFDFGWPAEAAAIPQLARRFRADLDKSRAELIANAEEEKASREKEGFDYHPFMNSTQYRTAGQSPRLLSLSLEQGGYEGGAHGNYGVGALLWDRAAAREIKVADIFAEPANMARLLTQRWCDALNRAREEKRGEPVGEGGLFDDCPPLTDIAIIPADKGQNGRFDTLMLVASPYVAGPWVEGAYEIELGVTPDMLAALKGDYRTSFEARQRQ